MSFGIKALKRGDKDQAANNASRIHVSTVICGYDLAAVLKLVELKRTHSPENLRLITPRFITRDYLVETYQNCVSTYRDNKTTLQIAQKYPDVRSTCVENESLFYKDGQWHKFGGRAKSMDLAPGEDYFLPSRQDFDIQGLFSETDWNELDETLKAYQNVRVLELLEKKNPQDLVNRDEWWMLFHDLGEVTCEDLWLSLPSRLVLKASKHGQTLPSEMAAYMAGVKSRAAISISWKIEKEIYPEPRTLFVPQSMTHEWGHFIVDVHSWDAKRNCHPVDVLILLQDEEPTSELMADKIKLAKRVLDRVFPEFEKTQNKEYIHASEDYFEIADESLGESLEVAVPKLHLLGAYAYGPSNLQFLARALLSI